MQVLTRAMADSFRALEQVEIYHHPADASAEKKMLDYFQMVAGEAALERHWEEPPACLGPSTAS